jgi:hypothetical protein
VHATPPTEPHGVTALRRWWCAELRSWVFLPRRWSRSEPQDALLDERRGANFLLLASETFDNITLRELGPLEPEWGWTSVRKVLGTADVYVGLKCKEVWLDLTPHLDLTSGSVRDPTNARPASHA